MNGKIVSIEAFGEITKVRLKLGHYSNGRVALKGEVAETGEPFATFTVNLPDSEIIPPGFAAIKDYSENEGFLDQLVQQGVIERPIGGVQSGYVVIPVCKVILFEEEGLKHKDQPVGAEDLCPPYCDENGDVPDPADYL